MEHETTPKLPYLPSISPRLSPRIPIQYQFFIEYFRCIISVLIDRLDIINFRMTKYVLDLLIREAELFTPCSWVTNPIWIDISADGLQKTFSTSRVSPCPHPSWNCGARLVLKLNTLAGSHFAASLMTNRQDGQPVAVARSQIRLETLPLGTPRKFAFPLMFVQDYSVQAASLCVTATISALSQLQSYSVAPARPPEYRPAPPPRTDHGYYPMPQFAPPAPQYPARPPAPPPQPYQAQRQYVPPVQYAAPRHYPEPQFSPNPPNWR